MAKGVTAHEVSHARHVVSFSDINLNPRFSPDPFTITTPIPNGLHVTVHEQRGINYEWRDGNIVKSIQQTSVANLEGNWFQGGSWIGRGLLLLAVLAAGGFGILFWYQRRGAKGALRP